MDGDERLTALKRAYADIILNTAKEAAARIMVSERKAVGFRHELTVAKDQALQTILRLKQMMDSKISEAEMTSLSQQRKIEELEAQLEEAEDILKDVREELSQVQAELERVRNSKSTREQTSRENMLITTEPQLLTTFTTFDMKNSAFNQRNEDYDCYGVNGPRLANSRFGKPNLLSTSEENRRYTSPSIFSPHRESRLESLTASDVKNSATNERNEVYKCYSNANGFGMGNSYVGKPDVPSVILRSTEPTPQRNRRTQRIRAFEEKLMAGELAFSETTDDVNYETSGKEDGEDDGICKTSADKAGNMRSTNKKELLRACKGRNQVQKVKSFQGKRRRATRYKKIETLSSMHLSTQAVKKDQGPDISHTSEANTVNINTQSCGDPSNVAPRLPSDTADKNTQLSCREIPGSDAAFVKACGVKNTMNEDKESLDKLLLTRQESGSADGSGVMICRMEVDKVDVPVVNSQTNASTGTTNGNPIEPVTDARVIKFTFQRKRKRGIQSSFDGNGTLGMSVLGMSVLKRNEAEKQNVPLETEKSSCITDSTRDSQRLAEVARQLVSLSEKKGCQ